jgi:hypothetical protein
MGWRAAPIKSLRPGVRGLVLSGNLMGVEFSNAADSSGFCAPRSDSMILEVPRVF